LLHKNTDRIIRSRGQCWGDRVVQKNGYFTRKEATGKSMARKAVGVAKAKVHKG
jgi:hypothetical protein